MMLELRNICKTYNQGKLDVPVLKDISLTVEEGEYVAIMGPSGSGKTTLMNIIGCLDSPSSGNYLLEGKDISQSSDSKLSDVRLHSIGFVFQSFYLLSRQSALENVALPLLYAGVRRKERLEIARKALERVGLGERVNFKPTQLSGGQCQRVAIARAIVNNPKVLLADEPTGALDTKSGEQIMEIFQKLNDEGVTIVMITHEPEIAAHAQRVLHIRDGRLLEAQTPKEETPKEEGPSLPADLLPPEEFHLGQKPQETPPPAPAQKETLPAKEETAAPVQKETLTTGEKPAAPVQTEALPAEEKPAAPTVERSQRTASRAGKHSSGSWAPKLPKMEKSASSRRPRHGAWISPAPAAAPGERRRAPEPAPMDKTAGTVLYEELNALLAEELTQPAAARPAPRAESPVKKAPPKAAHAKEGHPAHAKRGGFGEPIPTDLGAFFQRPKREQSETPQPLIPRTEF